MMASGSGRLLYVVVGGTTNTVSVSFNGLTTWLGLGTTIFSINGNAVACDSSDSVWVSLGQGKNTVAYSNSSSIFTWTGLATTIFGISGNGLVWANNKFIAVGSCNTNTIAYSSNGSVWTGIGTTNLYLGNSITYNPNNGLLVAGGTAIFSIVFATPSGVQYSTGSTINGSYTNSNIFTNFGSLNKEARTRPSSDNSSSNL